MRQDTVRAMQNIILNAHHYIIASELHMQSMLAWQGAPNPFPCYLFGPELSLAQGDNAEADVFDVTWTGSSILSRVLYSISTSP
jgi:hypothetical protein